MRVTPNQVVRNMQHLLTDRYYDMSKLQEQIASGKRLMKPSDQPMDTANVLNLTTNLSQLGQYRTNIEDSLAFMNVTDTSMQSMNNVLQRLRELAIAAGTDTITTQERIYFLKEVEQLTRSLVALVNTQYKSDYIFGGTETKIPPLDLRTSRGDTVDNYSRLEMAYFNAGGAAVPAAGIQIMNAFDNTPITNIMPGSLSIEFAGVPYVEGRDYTMDYASGTMTIINPALAVDVTPGTANYAAGQMNISFDYLTRGRDIYGATASNQGEVFREIEKGVLSRINVSADEFMNDPVTGADLVGTLIQYGQDLINNDTAAIGGAVDRLDQVLRGVLASQGANGARVNHMEQTYDRNADQTIYSTEQRSNLEDTDMTTAITDYSNMQNVYNAALKSAATVMQQSLINFL